MKKDNSDRFPTTTPPMTEILVMAVDALRSNTLRTGLTMLGVVIGISSVIAITSVGQGVQKATEKQIQALGTDVLVVLSGAARGGSVGQGIGSASTLTWDDARAIAQQAPAALGTSAFLQRSAQVVYQGTNIQTFAVGTDLNYPTVKNFYPQEGRYFTEDELTQVSRVVVLGSKVRDRLVGSDGNILNQRIRLRGEQFTVIGVMEAKGAVGAVDQDDQVYLPLSTMSARLVGRNALSGVSLSGVWVKAGSQEELDAAQFQVTNLLRIRHQIFPPQEDDFRITNQADLISTFSSVVGLFTVMVGAVGGISLVVGGIGIANIMLVSVVERTREIGIRKAVGATRSAILGQFLTEAVVVSLLGGTIGIGLGVGVALGASVVMKLPFIVSVEAIGAGFGLSFVVGLLAGGIPARNAARLDPIAALRSD